jgi:septal ring factor EnvC (AmiA/AmiB activator)
MTDIENIAKQLKEMKDVRKAFKKEYKEVFDANAKMNKSINAVTNAMASAMSEQEIISYEYDGMEFNFKSKVVPKHNMDKLGEIIDDVGKFDEYSGIVNIVKPDVTTRKSKRAKTE